MKKSWEKPNNERDALQGEEILKDFGLPSIYRKQEFFKWAVNKLVSDGNAEIIPGCQYEEYDIKRFQECTLITLQGYYFIENGGYTTKKTNDDAEDNRLKNIETSQLDTGKKLNVLTGWVAGGTIALVLVELLNLALEHHWFSCVK